MLIYKGYINKMDHDAKDLTPFFKFVRLLYKYRKFLIISNFMVFIFALVISFLLPKWYEGRVVFIINADSDLTGSLTSSVLTNVGLPGGLFGNQSAILADQYINFLSSHYILNKVDSIYHLQKEYKIKYKKIFYKRLLQYLQLINNGDNTITIKFYFKKDPIKAANIANTFFEELNKLVAQLKTENNRKVRIFLENTYTETIQKLTETEEKFAKYQQYTNIYSLEDQVKLAVDNLYNLEAEKINLEIQKLYFQRLGAVNINDYDATIKKIRVLNETIQSIKKENKYVDIPLEKLPTEGLEYLRLFREIKIREKILEFLIPQLENARLEEQRKVSNLQILDWASPQDYKAKPKRITVVFVMTFMSLIITILVMLITDFIKNNSRRLKQVFNE